MQIESPPTSIRVRISTNRPWVAGRLAGLLGGTCGIELLGVEETASAVSGQCGGQAADVLLMDCPVLAPEKALQLRRAARRHHPARMLWILDEAPTSRHAIRMVLDAVTDGLCHGYIAEECASGNVVRAISAVARHDIFLPRSMLVRALSEAGGFRSGMERGDATVHGGNSVRVLLTMRERQILRLVQIGLMNKEIGRQLDIEVDTVKKHLHNVYAKLGVQRRTQLMLRSAGVSRAPA